MTFSSQNSDEITLTINCRLIWLTKAWKQINIPGAWYNSMKPGVSKQMSRGGNPNEDTEKQGLDKNYKDLA